MSETKRSLLRIASNYLRLAVTFVLGLLLVPLLLSFGDEAYGLITLLSSTVGVGMWVEDIIRQTMICELGAAYHSGSRETFRRMYCTAMLISLGVGLVVLGAMGVIAALLPQLFNVPDALLFGGRWFVILYGLRLFVYIVLAPTFNMYLVAERMPAFNFWMASARASFPLAAWVVLLLGFSDQGEAITRYAALSAAFGMAVVLVPVAWLFVTERQLRPLPFRISRDAAQTLLTIGGWSTAANFSRGSLLLMGAVIMNRAFGVVGNMIYGIATQVCAYARMATGGMAQGLDAVSARINSVDAKALFELVRTTTLLHAWVAFPATLGVVVLAEPVITLWVAGRMEDPGTNVPQTIMLVQALAPGFAAMSLADGWLKVMYGAGQVRRYAPTVIAAALAYPLLSFVLLTLLPEGLRYQAVAWAFSILNGAVLVGLMPLIVARWINETWLAVMRPLLKPLLMTLCCAPLLLLAPLHIERWSFSNLFFTTTLFAAAYGTMTILVMFNRAQRRALLVRLRRSLQFA